MEGDGGGEGSEGRWWGVRDGEEDLQGKMKRSKLCRKKLGLPLRKNYCL